MVAEKGGRAGCSNASSLKRKFLKLYNVYMFGRISGGVSSDGKGSKRWKRIILH